MMNAIITTRIKTLSSDPLRIAPPFQNKICQIANSSTSSPIRKNISATIVSGERFISAPPYHQNH